MSAHGDVHDRLMAWHTELRAAAAGQRLDLPFAVGIISEDLGSVYDLNVLVVTSAVPPHVLLRSVERLATSAGWHHRRIEIDDPAVADRLRPALVDAGYVEERFATMRLDAPASAAGSDPATGDRPTASVAIDEQLDLAHSFTSQEPWARTREIVEQMVERERRLGALTGGRAVVAPPDQPVSRGLLLTDPARGLVEIDAVSTLSEARGQGWSRAVMARAIDDGRAVAGADIVLVADADDWPLRWYERLGFTTVGRSSAFRRDASA